jgi:hypothetical protein
MALDKPSRKVTRKPATRPPYFTVGQLREMLVGLDPDMPVLLPGRDHGYRTTRSPQVTIVGTAGDAHFSEWYGTSNSGPGEKPIDALVFE